MKKTGEKKEVLRPTGNPYAASRCWRGARTCSGSRCESIRHVHAQWHLHDQAVVARQVFDHTRPDYREQILNEIGGRGADLILEMLATVNLGYDLKLLAPNGRVVVIGSRGDVTLSPRDLMTRRGSIHAFTLPGITEAEEKEIHAGLVAGLENGTLRPVGQRVAAG